MAEDREILRELWNGNLPVQFTLSSRDISSIETPQPYFALLPRNSYFPLCLEKVVKHFSKFTSQRDDTDPWLDFDGIPLKLHYPIGLLFDLLAQDRQLPWNVTVNFVAFPADLIRFSNREMLEAYFMSTIKEADALKHKNTVLSNLQKKDHKQLWLGLVNDRFDQFWAVNRKLMEVPADSPSFRYIPFRIYQPDRPFIQKLIKPSEENRVLTLGDLIHSALPDFNNRSNAVVLIHGMNVELETPLQWLSEHLSYPDNFLHICVHSD